MSDLGSVQGWVEGSRFKEKLHFPETVSAYVVLVLLKEEAI